MREEYVVDLESQKTLLRAMNHSLSQQNQKLKQHYDVSQKLTGRSYYGLVLLTLSIIPMVFFVMYGVTPTEISDFKSKYLLQSLQGDTIDTWVHWNLMEDDAIAVNIVNADSISSEKIDAIKNAILSTEAIEIEDYLLHKAPKGTSSSTYYLGWQGALDTLSSSTKFPIPRSFVILESSRGEGDITIHLLNERDADGYTGYTRSTVENGYILKSSITIYNADNISADEIGTIMRHEFGHALGLGHSTATEDIMAPIVTTLYPYISQCNIDAISDLYDGKISSEVTCSK